MAVIVVSFDFVIHVVVWCLLAIEGSSQVKRRAVHGIGSRAAHALNII